MNYMILFVLNDRENFENILTAWEEAGVSGITILTSTGLGRMRNSALREDLPLIPRLEDLFRYEEISNHTFFTIVDREELVDRVVEATQNLIGDLDMPNTGILVVLPVARAYGLHRKGASPSKAS